MFSGWRGVKRVDIKLVSPTKAVRSIIAPFPVFVGDVQSVQLFLVGVLSKSIMVWTDIHRSGLRAVKPQGDRSCVGRGVGYVQTSRILLPEITKPHGKTANRSSS